ncbi:MAG: proline--tRNA ligase [Candidatus Aquicultor primus]|uniref:Proline--tRNA ligase n=1 Tax=Candidatus Aquicultor primus TaxID=1797195 RepID=A0A1F2UM95_9ACTN|nr:MAG: proline--tRNA ligase [Candidatus Aquicultor primus]HCG98834.1 proline--tRNA ligase [Actinomycetota bacterium]
MRFSRLFAPTLKESPAEAEVISHKLLLRAAMIRKVAAGIYTFLPLGNRTLKKIEKIVREEMDGVGAQEILMSALQPSDLWMKSGRWDQYGPEMMRLKDRHNRDFALGPTHEELVTDLAMKEARSYRQLPLTLYQIQVKFRDEIRPRFGLLRGREFIMKDAYSFNLDQDDLEKSYETMYHAYNRIFSRCGLEFRAVDADTGLIGGSVSKEFMVLADAGEDTVIYCDTCEYAANLEVAKTRTTDTPATETDNEGEHAVGEGDLCPECDGLLKSAKGIEVGQIFQLGVKYSEAMGATYIDENGDLKPYVMGCYGIGVSRLMAAAIEQHNDEGGIIWPMAIAPYHVEIVVLNYDRDEQQELADDLYNGLTGRNIEVLLDDRMESAGKKFADADLIGIPVQVVIGARTLKSGNIEVKVRATGERRDVPLEKAVELIADVVRELTAG